MSLSLQQSEESVDFYLKVLVIMCLKTHVQNIHGCYVFKFLQVLNHGKERQI